ncbi:MAG: ATP-binding cassette domain-containing protein [Burkholderiaceae bacterium]|jgi:tungstate transport system ATP-binding protein
MDSAPATDEIFPILLEDVRFETNGRRILDGLNARFEGIGRTVILGANGAGKTITMKLMHGLLAPTSGVIQWGASLAAPRNQAMVLQRPVLLRRSVIANVMYALEAADVVGSITRERARAALSSVGITALAQRPARLLSGGEQQRVALARALAVAPRVLFLDEPTSNLDPVSSHEIERVIGDVAESGAKVIMITHNLGQARRIADEVVFIDNGRVTEQTPAGEFFSSPRSSEAKAYLKTELP